MTTEDLMTDVEAYDRWLRYGELSHLSNDDPEYFFEVSNAWRIREGVSTVRFPLTGSQS